MYTLKSPNNFGERHIKPLAQPCQEKSELTAQRERVTTRIEGFWTRVTEAFGTEKVQEIAEKLDLAYQSVRKWKMGEVPGLDNLIHIKTLTGRSIDWLLTGDQKTIEPQSSLDYSEARVAETVAPYGVSSVDRAISNLIDARIAPLETEIANLKRELERCTADTVEKR